MPHRPAPDEGRFVFHVYNRAVEGVTLFDGFQEYEAFMVVMNDAMRRRPMPLLSYCLMSTHWHLVVWPLSVGSLSRFMHLLSLTHAMRWRRVRGTTGRGAVYQGRFQAVPVQDDDHLVRLIRYVERNAVKARLVARAEDWRWCSASPSALALDRPPLHPWPIPKPKDWLQMLETPEPSRAATEIRDAIRGGRPLGDPAWQDEVIKKLGWRFPAERREAAAGRGCELGVSPALEFIGDATL